MKEATESITELNEQHKLFILEEKDLVPNLLSIHRVQVLSGNKWLVYCDGVLVKQLDAGPHSWWNGFLHKWKAQIINTRVELLSIDVKGRVKGPSGPKEIPGAHVMELACEVTAQLQLSAKIVEVENFIQYRDPISVFRASIRNMIVELIGQLPYDHYGQWATELRDLVLDRLQGRSQGGRDDAVRRLGIRVEDAFVTRFNPSTANDRNMLQMYQLVERARRELVEVQANAQRDNIVARSYAEQGAVLNIAPSILALQDSPVGQALIDRDAELRGLMVHAGLTPGVSVTMQPPGQPGQPVPGQALNPPLGYLHQLPPAAASALPPATGPFVNQGGGGYQKEVTGQIYAAEKNDSAPLPSFAEEEPPVDSARQSSELTLLKQGNFIPAGSGKVTPRYDEWGNPLPGSKEWVLQVTQQRNTGYLMIIFACPAGYPVQPPRVQMKAPTGGGFIPMEPNSITSWHPGRTLLEVAQEVSQSLPPA